MLFPRHVSRGVFAADSNARGRPMIQHPKYEGIGRWELYPYYRGRKQKTALVSQLSEFVAFTGWTTSRGIVS